MNNRISWFDSLRGFACLIVLIAHYCASCPGIGINASGTGKIGVWLFFLMAGFFSVYSLITSDNILTFRMNDLINYYIKRLFRILPSYIVILLILCFFQNISVKDVIKHIFLLEGTGHFWTIPVELKAYIIFSIIFLILNYWIKTKNQSIIFLIALTILTSIAFPYTKCLENDLSVFYYLPVFFLGMILCFVIKNQKQYFHFFYDILIILVLCSMIIAIPGVRSLLFKIPADGYLQNKYLFIGFGWFVITYCIFHSKYFRIILEKNHFLKFIGKISFSLYLIHYILLQYTIQHTDNLFIRFLMVTVVSILLAAILERIIERPCNKFCKIILNKINTNNYNKKYTCIFLLILFIILLSVLEIQTIKKNTLMNISTTNVETTSSTDNTWKNQLYVPTMINKIGNDYFIVDCWNSRILYSNTLKKEISEWNVLIEDHYLGGHTIVSDGELLVADNTDLNSVLVFKRNTDGTYTKTQTIENINARPHYIVYDDTRQIFYTIGSTTGTIYSFKNINGTLHLIKTDILEELTNSYVRSISLIDGYLYTVSGPGSINQYNISENGFELVNQYSIPDDLFGMNQIIKIGDYFVITNNTNKNGDVSYSNIIITDDLTKLQKGSYKSYYKEMGFVGQPYYITYFDNKYWITEISETKGNGIKSFSILNGEIVNTETYLYWDEVKDSSKQRWQSQIQKYSGQPVDVCIFAGQSNMSGKGDAAKAPQVTHGYEYRSISDPTTLYPITEPFGIFENNPEGINDTTDGLSENNPDYYRKKGSLVSSFANAYYKTTGVPIVAVSASEGNTSIDEWIEGTPFFTDLTNRTNAVIKYLNSTSDYSIRHVYLVWCQGENDGDIGTSSKKYLNKLNNMVKSLISKTAIEKCFIIRIGNNREKPELYDDIMLAQTNLCQKSNDFVLVSTKFAEMAETGLMIDSYHYTQKGYNLVGKEAGKYAGYYTLYGIKPHLWDYEWNTEFIPS